LKKKGEKMRIRRWVLAVSLLLVSSFLEAQSPRLEDVLVMQEKSVMLPLLREPFPWGAMPSPEGRELFVGAVRTVESVEQDIEWVFGQMKTGAPKKRLFQSGEDGSDWKVNDEILGWTSDSERFVLKKDGSEEIIISWQGEWDSPQSIRYFEKWNPEPLETWLPREGSEGIWEKRSGSEISEIWIRTISGSTTSWTAYDKDGDEIQRIIVEKDANGNVVKAQYWTSPETQDYEATLEKNESATTLYVESLDDYILEAGFSKNQIPEYVKGKQSDMDPERIEYLPDNSGRITSLRHFVGDTESERISFSYDQTGNMVEMITSTPFSAFGETVFRQSNKVTRNITYRKPGENQDVFRQLPAIDAWLQRITEEYSDVSDDTVSNAASVDGSDGEISGMPSSGESADKGKWRTTSNIDPLTDTVRYFVFLDASISNKQYSWEDNPSLWLRKTGDGLELFISFDEILDDEQVIALRFDADPAIFLDGTHWSRSTDSKAAFIFGYPENGKEFNLHQLIEQLLVKNKLYVQAKKYDDTKVDATFDLPGLKAAIESEMPLDVFLGK